MARERMAILEFRKKVSAETLSEKLSALGIPHIFAEVGPAESGPPAIFEHGGQQAYDDSWPTLGYCIHVPGKTISEVRRIARYDQATVAELAAHLRGQRALPLEG